MVRRRSAFTLIELITVIGILGILGVAVAGPTVGYMGTMRSNAAGTRIVADIRYAQRLALASGLRTWVVLSTGSNNYQLYAENRANPGKANRVAATNPFSQSSTAMQLGASPFNSVSLTAVNINSTSEIEFDSFGKPYDANGVALAANGTITLNNGVTITVYPVSGFVER